MGRTFTYSQTALGGNYEFTMPYSTEGPIPGETQTQFDTRPIAPYTISYGNTTVEVRVGKMDVLNGNMIVVNQNDENAPSARRVPIITMKKCSPCSYQLASYNFTNCIQREKYLSYIGLNLYPRIQI